MRTIDLKQPSYKWVWCQKCNQIEVKVSEEAVAATCCWCLVTRCDYMPREQTPKKKSTKVVSEFKKMQEEDEQLQKLADAHKQKKDNIKNGIVEPKKKKTTKKKPKKKTRKRKKVTA